MAGPSGKILATFDVEPQPRARRDRHHDPRQVVPERAADRVDGAEWIRSRPGVDGCTHGVGP